MGKKRDPSAEDDPTNLTESPGSGHKKHKKHKKKHKKKKDHGHDHDDSVLESTSQEDSSPTKPAIKLKIKIGGQTISAQSTVIGGSPPATIISSSETPSSVLSSKSTVASILNAPPVNFKTSISAPSLIDVESTSKEGIQWEGENVDDTFVTKKKGEDTSDEEQEWLDALEAGTLDDNGEVKKTKDSKLLTARQRSLLHGTCEEKLQQLPSGYKETELTEEQLERRQQRASKRRQQAFEKREKDKKQTLERLLKKQDAKSKGSRGRGGRRHNIAPMFRYIQKANKLSSISVPQGFSFPMQKQLPISPKKPNLCGMKGCQNLKKYSCSKTGVPLCSLQCYKKNQQRLTLSMASAR